MNGLFLIKYFYGKFCIVVKALVAKIEDIQRSMLVDLVNYVYLSQVTF